VVVHRFGGIAFPWDERKAAANVRRHGITFEEAATAFVDPMARLFDDPSCAEAIRANTCRPYRARIVDRNQLGAAPPNGVPIAAVITTETDGCARRTTPSSSTNLSMDSPTPMPTKKAQKKLTSVPPHSWARGERSASEHAEPSLGANTLEASRRDGSAGAAMKGAF
jgi:hypothetical protein